MRDFDDELQQSDARIEVGLDEDLNLLVTLVKG